MICESGSGAHYQLQLIDLYREQQGFHDINPPDTDDQKQL
jgi:hypothetical protein